MAIAFSQSNGGVTTAVGLTNTITPTINTITNGGALVWVESSVVGVDPTSVTWGGVAMTKINTLALDPAFRPTQISLWGLSIGTVSTGSVAITATFASSLTSNISFGVYSDVTQSTAVSAWQNSTNGTSGGTTTTNEITTSITPSVSNGWLVAFGVDLASSFTPSGGTTQRYWGNFSLIDSGGVVSGPSTVGGTMGSSALFGNNAVLLPPFAVATTPKNLLTMGIGQ